MRNYRHWAACRQADPDIFFPEKPTDVEITEAQMWCNTCPVRLECLAEGTDNDLVGIWGGVLNPGVVHNERAAARREWMREYQARRRAAARLVAA